VLRSVLEILDPLGVASLGLPATDTDHVKTFRAGLERAIDFRSDGQHVPRETYGRSMRQVFASMAGAVDRFE
jgi:hypothetical protein